jgi:putative endonuclease
MLECAGGRIYTGASPDVAARFAAHRAGRGGAFTRGFPPIRILRAKRCATRGAALRLEHALKQLPRPAKLEWAAGAPWPRLGTRLRTRRPRRAPRD